MDKPTIEDLVDAAAAAEPLPSPYERFIAELAAAVAGGALTLERRGRLNAGDVASYAVDVAECIVAEVDYRRGRRRKRREREAPVMMDPPRPVMMDPPRPISRKP